MTLSVSGQVAAISGEQSSRGVADALEAGVPVGSAASLGLVRAKRPFGLLSTHRQLQHGKGNHDLLTVRG